MRKRTFAPGQEYAILEIDDVDVVNRFAHCFDKTKAPVMASFREAPGGILYIPVKGQRWTAKRQGWVWHLENRLDSLSDQQFVEVHMHSGDVRITAVNTVFINSEATYMNLRGIGPTVKDSFWVGEELGYWSVYLSLRAVSDESTVPYLNGLAVTPDIWRLEPDMRTIIFDEYLAGGNIVVVYQTWDDNMDDAAVVTGHGLPGNNFVNPVARFDTLDGDAAYAAIDLGSDQSDIWIEFNYRINADAIDAFGQQTLQVYTSAGIPAGIVLNMASINPSLLANTWYTIEYHYVADDDSDLYINGILIDSFGTPNNLARIIGIGNSYTSFGPAGISYYDNVKIGTTRHDSDLFSDDFEDQTFDAWTVVQGDATIVGLAL